MAIPIAHEEIARGFDERGPWVTRFTIDGRSYGGELDFRDDVRLRIFASEFPNVQTVLELGSLEGGHTFELARSGLHVTAVEARADNLNRARYMQRLVGLQNVDFVKANLEVVRLADFGRFDVVFCSGLLYHLPRPWVLLDELATVADAAFLWTHYAAQVEDEVEGVPGLWFAEGPLSDPLSGVSPKSFWMTLPEIVERLRNDFSNVRVVSRDTTHVHGPNAIIVAQR